MFKKICYITIVLFMCGLISFMFIGCSPPKGYANVGKGNVPLVWADAYDDGSSLKSYPLNVQFPELNSYSSLLTGKYYFTYSGLTYYLEKTAWQLIDIIFEVKEQGDDLLIGNLVTNIDEKAKYHYSDVFFLEGSCIYEQ